MHGGWWKVDKIEEIKSEVAIEFLPSIYARALDDGSIVLGDPHPPGEGPDDEEVFTSIHASNNHIALKSGFGRYLSIDRQKQIVGLSEAIGEKELFFPVFESNETALSTYDNYFLGPDIEIDNFPIVAKSTIVSAGEKLSLRVRKEKNL